MKLIQRMALMLGGLSPALCAQPPAEQGTVKIEGSVVDEHGQGLAHVAVCLLGGAVDTFVTKELVANAAARTNAAGRYVLQLDSAAAGRSQRLLLVAKGRVHVTVPLRSACGWPVVLPRACVLAGRVVDAAGQPIADVRVEASDWIERARYRADSQALAWLPRPLTASRTDARGRFVIPGTLASGVRFVVGSRSTWSRPYALGDAIEIVVRRPDARQRGPSARHALAGDAPESAGEPLEDDLLGKAGLDLLPRHGLGVQLERIPAAKKGGVLDQHPRFVDTRPIAADGSFRLPRVDSGNYRLQLVVPRPLQQGAPDVIDVETVEIRDDTRRIAFDAKPHLPAKVHGTVRGSVPAGRMLVGASGPNNGRGYNYGYAYYECGLAAVAPNGSYSVQVRPGDCTVFVIDLMTGMMLHREPLRELAGGAESLVDMDVRAGVCDVKVQGLSASEVGWLEMIVPSELWPRDIGRMNISRHEFTKRIGYIVPPGCEQVRLFLPPADAELWLVKGWQGDLKRQRGEAVFSVAAEQVVTASVAFPGGK